MTNNPTPGVDAPLLGTFNKLEDLFQGVSRFLALDRSVPDTSDSLSERFYRDVPGYYPLAGIPGSVNDVGAIFVRPYSFVVDAIADRCGNGVIGGFKVIRSAYWLKHGLLPVYVFDFHRFVSVFIALVDAGEHDRFNPGGK